MNVHLLSTATLCTAAAIFARPTSVIAQCTAAVTANGAAA